MELKLRTEIPKATWRPLPIPQLSLLQRINVFYADRIRGAWLVLSGKAWAEEYR